MASAPRRPTIGAVSVGSGLFLFAAIFGIGVMFGLDYFVAHAYGAGRLGECRRWLLQAAYLALILTPPLMFLAWLPAQVLERFGMDPEVQRLAGPYVEVLALSILPLLLYSSFRRYLQARSMPGVITVALVSANLVNAGANWVLIFGHLGMPEMGVTGAAWATLVSRVYLAGVLFCWIVRQDRHRFATLSVSSLKPEPQRLRSLFRLGFPAALQVTLEVGVFATATALAGVLDPISLAAHQVALAVASFTFMVPLGIASAGAVLVGQALGGGRPGEAASAGWTALTLGGGFMLLAALTLWVFPASIIRLFTFDTGVLKAGIPLLGIAAVFQVFDGLQVVATGILRGTGETRIPVLATLVCHWLVGLPLGYYLCFPGSLGISGLWSGLSLGLIVVALCLVGVWSWRILKIQREHSVQTEGGGF